MSQVDQQVRTECIRRIDESEARIARCLSLLSQEQVWHHPNTSVVSVGNLVLHLCGNVGQWVNSTLGDRPDERDRDREFHRTGVAKEELIESLKQVLDEAKRVITGLGAAELTRTYKVQGFQESGTGILVHVVEHLSYHTGQISLHAKLALDVDLGYYAGQDLNAKS